MNTTVPAQREMHAAATSLISSYLNPGAAQHTVEILCRSKGQNYNMMRWNERILKLKSLKDHKIKDFQQEINPLVLHFLVTSTHFQLSLSENCSGGIL